MKISIKCALFLVVACVCASPAALAEAPAEYKLEGILTGSEIDYPSYKKFTDKFFVSGVDSKNGGPVENLTADTEGGSFEFSDATLNAGRCSATFTWKFDRGIETVKAGEEVGVTLTYKIERKACVKELPQGWIAFTVNDGYFEQFLGEEIEKLLTENSEGEKKFSSGPEGGAVELIEGKAEGISKFKIRIPGKEEMASENEDEQPAGYFALRMTVFRYYYPNTPVAVYVFGAP